MAEVPGKIEIPSKPEARVAAHVARRPLRGVRFSLSKGLCADDAERRQQIVAMREVVSDAELEKVHSWIHTNLTILDGKAQSILSLYSIALATLTIFYVSIGTAPLAIYVTVILGFAVIAWSIVPLARIAFVYWNTTEEFKDPEALLADLLRVRDVRTRVVRLSLLKGIPALAIFTIIFGWYVSQRV